MTYRLPALLLIASSILCAAASGAAAQERPALRLSLSEAQAMAVDASHRLAEARARLASVEAVVGVREAAERPVVSVAAGYTRTNHVTEFVVPGPTGVPRVLYPDVPDNYLTRLNLQWPIFSGGRADALARAARADASASAADVAAAQADLRLEVARAYWALVTAQAARDVLRQNLARAQSHLADVRERFAAGFVPPDAVAAAEARESRGRMLVIEGENQSATASAELARLLGADLDRPLVPAEVLDPPADQASAQASALDALAADARLRRQERQALQHRIAAADEQQRAADAGRRPTVAITGGVDYARPNPRIFPRADRWDDAWDAGVSVAWSLWDGGRTRAEAAQAAGAAEAARQRLAEFDSLLALGIRQRLLDLESSRAAVAAAEDARRAAAEAQRVVGERYRAGVAPPADVLDADLALLQADLDRTRAIAAVRLAEARLARELGR